MKVVSLISDRINGDGIVKAEVNSSGNYYVLVDNSFDTEDYSLTATYSLSTVLERQSQPNSHS